MSPGKCTQTVQGYKYTYLYRRHNYIYLLRFKVLMEPILLVFLKLMGATISGHWDLRDTGTTRGRGSGQVRVRPWVAVAQKRHILTSSVMLGCQNGCVQ